jgi:hypothetical protein
VFLPEHRIARMPVTVAQFTAFMAANQDYRTTAEKLGWVWNWTDSRWQHINDGDWGAPARA